MPAARRADLAYAVGVIVGVAFIIVSGAVAVHDRGAGLTNDFGGIWAGARAIVDGHDPYDPATWRAIAAAYGTQPPDTAVYGYPRWVALALVPFALLPIDVAATLWLWGGIALAVLGVHALLRAAVPGIPLAHAVVGGTLFVAQPGYQTVANGQWTFLLLAGSSAALVLVRRSRPRAAALSALVWLAKPHLFVGDALGAAGRSRGHRHRARLGRRVVRARRTAADPGTGHAVRRRPRPRRPRWAHRGGARRRQRDRGLSSGAGPFRRVARTVVGPVARRRSIRMVVRPASAASTGHPRRRRDRAT
jgi:hypothetical protein